MRDPEFIAEIDASLIEGVPRACGLIAFAFTVFLPVDMSFAPDDIRPFILFRALIVLVALTVLFLSFTRWGRTHRIIRFLAYLVMTNCAIGVSWLTHMTGGSASPYWTMLMLTFFGGAMLLRFSIPEALILYGSHIAIYALILLYRGESPLSPTFITSVGGMLVALVVSITGQAYIRLLMYNEFKARRSLAAANARLEASITELQYKRQQEQLRYLQNKLDLANDLHDSVGAKLSQIAVIADSDRIDDTRALKALAASVLENVRNFAHILKGEERVATLNSQLSRLADSLRALGRYEVTLSLPESEIHLSDMALLNIERILSEWTANAIRHARATQFALGSRAKRQKVTVYFFQDRTPFTWRGKAERGGLRSIAQRANNIAASVAVRAHRGGALFVLRLKPQAKAASV
jgi:signal transduction histidine kinase